MKTVRVTLVEDYRAIRSLIRNLSEKCLRLELVLKKKDDSTGPGTHVPCAQPLMIWLVGSSEQMMDQGKILNILTARERDALRLIANGFSSKEIAHELKISMRTAAHYRQSIMMKLGIHHVAGLTKYALIQGLSELDF